MPSIAALSTVSMSRLPYGYSRLLLRRDCLNRPEAGAAAERLVLWNGLAADYPLELEATEVQLCDSQRTVVIHRPVSVEAVLEYYIDHDMFDRDPYWCSLWPAAFATTRLMEDFATVAAEVDVLERLRHGADCPPRLALAAAGRGDWIRGCHVVDFGCGLGLPGIVAALSGAERVDMIDREELALESVRRSAVEGNILDRVNLVQASWSNGAEDLRAKTSPEAEVILAADILYEEDSIADVANVISVLLRDTPGIKNGEHAHSRFAIVADPPKRTVSNRTRFQEICTGKHGLEIVQFTMQVAVPGKDARAESQAPLEDVVMMIIFRALRT